MTHEVQVRPPRTRPGGSRRTSALPFPLATERRATGPGIHGTPILRPLRVLVVDDCHDTTDSTAELIVVWGHDARRAYAGADAPGLAAEYRPDVLLVDLAMPVVGGCEVARRVRRLPGLGRVLLVAVTGYPDADNRRRAADAGFDFYMVKPVDPATLEALLMSHEIEPSADLATPPVAPARHRILVVDDDAGVRRVLAAGLPRQGFTVSVAADGREAADLLGAGRPAVDVVLMDVRMPGRDGPATLTGLRARYPQVRCCFMTGDPGGHSEEGLRLLDTGEVLHKPFTMAEAGRVLRAEIGRREGEEAARDDHWRDDGGQGQRPAP